MQKKLIIKVKEKIDKKIVLTAIVTLGIIEVVALIMGINGALLRWVTIIIAGLAGLIIPTPKIIRR